MLARTQDPAQDYHTRAAADRARYDAECAAVRDINARALWNWLGDRPAAMLQPENSRSSLYDLSLTIIGKTAEAVEAVKADYLRRHPFHVYLTQFGKAQPWHQGFRMTGTRREQV